MISGDLQKHLDRVGNQMRQGPWPRSGGADQDLSGPDGGEQRVGTAGDERSHGQTGRKIFSTGGGVKVDRERRMEGSKAGGGDGYVAVMAGCGHG